MANDWLKINVNGQGWGTTGSGPSGTTPVTISASSCDETIARSATIVFRAGSLTKRLKVTQGIAASPKIQLLPTITTIGKNQETQITLTVSNVDELTGWYWEIEHSTVTGVLYTGPASGNTTPATLKVKNNTATSGNYSVTAKLYTQSGNLLSQDTKTFVLTGDQNPEPVITLLYDGGNEILLHSGSTESIKVLISNVPSTASYTWSITSSRPNEMIINPASGTTSNVTVNLTNESHPSGETWISASLQVTFSDGTQKNAGSNSISITYLPPDYHYRIVVDSQPATTLNYNSSTTISFHVEDTDGHTPEDGLSWRLECSENWMNAHISRTPSYGTFTSSGNFSDSSNLVNTSTLWGTTSVTLNLSLIKDGEVIDYIEGETNINRYINRITINPRPILTITDPQPDQGYNVSEIGFAWIGEVKKVKFVSNMPWTVWFDTPERGFTIESGGSSGPACANNSDYVEIQIRGPRNTSTAVTIQDMFRIDNGGASRYAGLCVNPKEPLYIELLPMDGQEVHYLDAVVKDPALEIPISANVSTFSFVYSSIDYGNQKPNWLGVRVEQTSSYPQANVNNVLILSTESENDTEHERPTSSSLLIRLTAVDDYGTPDDPRDDEIVTSNEIKIKQSPKSTDIYTVYVNNEPVWTNDGQGGPQMDTFQAPTAGWTSDMYGRVLRIERQDQGGASIVSATWAWDGNGMLKRPSTSGGGGWADGDGEPFSATQALLRINANSLTTTALTHVRIFEDQNMSILMWQGTWWQDPEPIENPCTYTVSWSTPGNKTKITGSVTIGSSQIDVMPFYVDFYRQQSDTNPRDQVYFTLYKDSEYTTLPSSGEKLTPGNTYYFSSEEDSYEADWGEMTGYIKFRFNSIETNFIALSSSGSATSPQ